MALLNGSIPNLISGVSQQSSELRFPGQLDSQLNCLSSPSLGLVRRPPSEHVGLAGTDDFTNYTNHFIETSDGRRIAITFLDDDIEAVDLDTGIDVPVQNVLDSSILGSSVVALTYGDSTIVANTDTTLAMSNSSRLPRLNVSFSRVVTAIEEVDYRIHANFSLNAGTEEIYTTFGYQATSLDTTEDVASSLTGDYYRSIEGDENIKATSYGSQEEGDLQQVRLTWTPPIRMDLSVDPPVPADTVVIKYNGAVLDDTNYPKTFWTDSSVLIENAGGLLEGGTNDGLYLIEITRTGTAAGIDSVSQAVQTQGSTIYFVPGTYTRDIPLYDSKEIDGATRTSAIDGGGAFTQFVYDYTETTINEFDTIRVFKAGNELTVIGFDQYYIYVSDIVAPVTSNMSADASTIVDSVELTSNDGIGDQGLDTFSRTAPDIVDLPNEFFDGAYFEIQGDPGTDTDDYYVVFESDTGLANAIGPGRWVETYKDTTDGTFNNETFPFLIEYRPGTQDLSTSLVDYNQMLVGDFEDPSFIGEQIVDVKFHRNRLAFLTPQHIVLSRSGDLFNFWRRSATTIFDDDPIDLNSSDETAGGLSSMIPFNGELLLFSPRGQQLLRGEPFLTPQTASTSRVSTFNVAQGIKPIEQENVAIIASQDGSYLDIRQYDVDGSGESYVAPSLTLALPTYIPTTAFAFVPNTHARILVMPTTDGSVYVYQWSDSSEGRIQSAWHKWDLGTKIAGCAWFDNELKVLVVRANGSTYVESLDFVGFGSPRIDKPWLDRLTFEDPLGGVYLADTNETVVTGLPYTPEDNAEYLVVDATTGQVLQQTRPITGGAIYLRGDKVNTSAYVGAPYTSSFGLSEFKVDNQNRVPITGTARMTMKSITVHHVDTSHFIVSHTAQDRDKTWTKEFDGRRVAGEIPWDTRAERTDVFRVPVRGRPKDLVVTVETSESGPFQFTMIDWTAQYFQKGRRV